MKKSHFLAAIFGNVFDHYDNAIFGLLVPFIAPLFFPNYTGAVALILTYAMLAIGIVTRPLGALFFGYIGDVFGRKKALSLTLVGASICTFSMGFIPIYKEIGIFAPILLAFLKGLQDFFSASETPGGAIFILENCKQSKKTLFSGIYSASSIFGILLASLVIFLSADYISKYWRYLFFIAGITAFLGIFIRLYATEPKEFLLNKKQNIAKIFRKNFATIIYLVFIIGFAYSIYVTSIVMMNGFLPLVSLVSKKNAMGINVLLLSIDLILLPLVASFLKSKKRLMFLGCFLTLFSFYIFSYLKGATFLTAFLIRGYLLLISICFFAPLHFFVQEKIHPSHRFRIVALSFALGVQLLGKPASFISLWIFEKTNLVEAPAIYLLILCLFAFLSILKISKRDITYNILK